MIFGVEVPVPLLGGTTLGMIVLNVVLSFRSGYVKQHGGKRRRQRARLARVLDRWSPKATDAAVNWHDYPALTKRDIVEALYERGWYYRGQDIHGARWPLHATRDPRLAESAGAPPSREQLLRAELGDVVRSGAEEYLLDLVPYVDLPRGTVGAAAGRAGFRIGVPRERAFPMKARLIRTGVHDADQDPDWVAR